MRMENGSPATPAPRNQPGNAPITNPPGYPWPMRCVVAMVTEQLWQKVPGGSGVYITELVGALRPIREIALVGLAARHRKGSDPESVLSIPVISAPLPRRALYDAWNTIRLPRAEQLFPSATVVHSPTLALAPTRRPSVVTVHDLAFLRSPEHFTARGVRYFTRSLRRVIAEADAIIVPSETTAVDCREAGIDGQRLHVIPHGVTASAPTGPHLRSFRARRGLDRPYLLWTGTVEPRKNLPKLLEAFQQVAAVEPEVDLVLVGPSGWGDTEAQLANSIDPRRLHVLGRLSEADLACAYAGARAFCFPSIWEGFGLPVLEAMAHGVPVVTSAGTSTEEVAGQAAILIDPADADAIAEGMLTAIGPRHDELSTAGRARAQIFTWAAAAKAHAEVYRTLC